MVTGAAAIAIGALLLLNVAAPAAILVLLAGGSLAASGLIELSRVDRYGRRPTAFAAGAVFFVAGLVAVLLPSATLWAIALTTGVGLVVSGTVRAVTAVPLSKSRDRGIQFVGDLASVIAGVLAVLWPEATIVVLAVTLGARTVLVGAIEVGAALALARRSSSAANVRHSAEQRLSQWPYGSQTTPRPVHALVVGRRRLARCGIDLALARIPFANHAFDDPAAGSLGNQARLTIIENWAEQQGVMH